LEDQRGIGQVMRDVAENLAPSAAVDLSEIPAGVERMLDQIARMYTMANERTVFDRIFGRATQAAPAKAVATELEDFLF
jgi:hypothetical protein